MSTKTPEQPNPPDPKTDTPKPKKPRAKTVVPINVAGGVPDGKEGATAAQSNRGAGVAVGPHAAGTQAKKRIGDEGPVAPDTSAKEGAARGAQDASEAGACTSEAPRTMANGAATASTTVERIKLADVRRDQGLMMRVQVNDEAVQEYAEKYKREKAGALAPGEKPFPLCVLFRTPEGIVRVHGWHRMDAMDRAGITEWDFEVRSGTRAEAAQFAAAANKESNSVRYTNADKRNAVKRLLAIPELRGRTDQVIADLCGVDHKTVSKYREPEDKEQPKTGKDNKVRRKPTRSKPKSKAATREIPKSRLAQGTQGGTSDAPRAAGPTEEPEVAPSEHVVTEVTRDGPTPGTEDGVTKAAPPRFVVGRLPSPSGKTPADLRLLLKGPHIRTLYDGPNEQPAGWTEGDFQVLDGLLQDDGPRVARLLPEDIGVEYDALGSAIEALASEIETRVAQIAELEVKQHDLLVVGAGRGERVHVRLAVNYETQELRAYGAEGNGHAEVKES